MKRKSNVSWQVSCLSSPSKKSVWKCLTGYPHWNRTTGFAPLCIRLSLIHISADGTGAIEEIKPRKNQLIRPPVANLDQLVIVASTCEPSPNPLVIDKMLALAVDKGIHPLLVISKADLGDSAELSSIYEKSGIDIVIFSIATGEGLDIIRSSLAGKISAFTGNSGVGKSSLLNCIDPHFQLATGPVSYTHLDVYKRQLFILPGRIWHC